MKKLPRLLKCRTCSALYHRAPWNVLRGTGFCSRECYTAWRERKSIQTCLSCGTVTKCFGARHPVCSPKCAAEYRKHKPIGGRGHKTGVFENCKHCGKQFYRNLCRPKNTFCSTLCRDNSRWVFKKCPMCSQSFRTRKSSAKKFCSRPCVKRASLGQNNPLWRGGQNRHGRGITWPAQSKAARARDKNICRICGKIHIHKIDPKPDVDHVVPYRYGGTNDLVNLVSTCKSCHMKKTAIEIKFARGDRLGYESALRELGWPMDVVEEALHFWGQNPQMPILFRGIGKRQRTHCKRGHLWIDANIKICKLSSGKTMRYCLLCRKHRNAKEKKNARTGN